MTAELLAPFEKMLGDICPPSVIRSVEAGSPITGLWSSIESSGFLDALVAEVHGGAGLSLADVGALAHAIGQHAVPAPVSQTIVARALIAPTGSIPSDGPIVLVVPASDRAGLVARAVPQAMVARHALIERSDRLVLAPLNEADVRPTGVRGSLGADIAWHSSPAGIEAPLPPGGLRPIAAALRAAEIGGTCSRLLDMTTAYARDRVQFGKPIARLQAIQQQLAVMAEQVVLVRMAAQVGCRAGFPPPMAAAATAKQIASVAAVQVASTGHAIHGAIGLSEEFDLQIFSRRLHEWRLADGSEGYWAKLLGRARLVKHGQNSLKFAAQIAA